MSSTLLLAEGLLGEGLSAEGLAACRGNHESGVWCDSEAVAGVRFRVKRISVARKIELARAIREIGRRAEFLEAGSEPREKLEAAVVAGEIDEAYLAWGLEALEGLTIDGEAATPRMLIEKGPLALAGEVIGRIKRECGLSEDDRKN
jgi:hypothetical protein